MAITQNSAYNLDTDIRKFTDTLIFLVPLNINIFPWLKTKYPFTVDRIIAQTATGSINLTMKKISNGVTTTMGDASNIPIGTNYSTISPSSGNSLIVDDTLMLTFTNSTNATIMHIQIDYTRNYTQA